MRGKEGIRAGMCLSLFILGEGLLSCSRFRLTTEEELASDVPLVI
jgi:hypothetical protein